MSNSDLPHPDGRGKPVHHCDWENYSPHLPSPSPSDLEIFFYMKSNGTDLDIREIYRFEINRLNSYIGWPKSACAYPTKLAKAGFYYLGTSDTVGCYVCNVQVGQWERGDVPWKEHAKHSPRCPFVLGTDKTNVPLLSAGSESSACEATNGGAEHDELTTHGAGAFVPHGAAELVPSAGEVFDSAEASPKNEALAEFQKLLEKYPYTSLNTEKVKTIIEKYKQQTNGRIQNGYLDLPKDIAQIEFQSLLEKYPYSSLNTDKIQQIVSNFHQNIAEVNRNGLVNQHGMQKNGYHHENARTNNVSSNNAPPATGAAAGANSAGAASSESTSLRVDDRNGTLERGGHDPTDPVSPPSPDGPNTVQQTQSDAVPFGHVPPYNPRAPHLPNVQHRGNNGISIISEVLRQIVAEPVRPGLQEHCPLDDLTHLAQSPSAQNPQYAHINKRLASFAAWPYRHMQPTEVLAEAGFFYTGQEDRVRCWFCNGGLCNWEKEDIPWYEHERWFGRCQYLLKCAQKSTVVRAIIDTAKHINEAAVPPPHFHQHGHIHHGQTQCDTEQQQSGDIWSMDTVKVAMDMGYSKNRIQVVVNSKGHGILSSIEQLVDALIVSEPAPEPLGQEPQRPVAPPPQVQSRESQQAKPEPEPSKPAPTDLESLRKENEELKSANLCKVCLSEQISIIFLPCSHLVCCLECGLQLQKCPLCRQAIKATSRVFL